jgi:hypothetical protein
VQLTRSFILQNYSAEQALSASNWVLKGAAVATQDATQFYIGTKSVKVVTSANATGVDGTKQSITLNDSTTYSLNFYALGNGTTENIEAGYSSDGSTDNTVCITGQALSTSTLGWINYTCTFTTPSSHSGTPYIYIKSSTAAIRTFYLDSIQLSTGNAFTAYREGTISLNGIVVSPTTSRTRPTPQLHSKIQNAAMAAACC